MPDRRLIGGVLVGMTLTTTAALGLYYYWYTRRSRSSPLIPEKQVPVQYPSGKPHQNSKLDKLKNVSPETIQVSASTTSADEVVARAEEWANNANVSKPEDKQLVEEITIPKDVVAGIIGKKGCNIKQIQKDSNTRINFKDETLENGDRLCVIKGRPDDVSFAQDLINKFISAQPVAVTKEILIPRLSIGRIIGRNGETIRGIQDMSKAKVNIDSDRYEVREGDSEEYGVVMLKGTQDQIDLAESLILEQVEEEKNFRNRIKGVAATRTPRRVNAAAASTDVRPQPQDLPLSKPVLRPNGIVEVYVSCVYHPNLFWIQQVGQDSIELDKLGEAMTDHYSRENSRKGTEDPEGDFQVGDIVASPFQLDDKMYRAKIISFDGTTAEVEYVDYGDRRNVSTNQLRAIAPTFLSLKFQAVEASLNLECPESKWPDDTITTFCDLSYCAQWKSLTAKVKGFLPDENGSSKNVAVCLELMDRESNIGDEMIKQGLATKRDEFIHKLDGPRRSPQPPKSS
ncbi:unnamed protein product [Allacma fusca]|uniref:Tudor domain-containing protein n=1 Tax=Allacma fusca TaxID=39272 RepID=A0A8J2PEU6_9HEXA|nr:unnamed protein product [Allacma fusca]